MIYTVILISLIGPLIGAFIGVFKKYTKQQIYLMLSFASGVMLSISFFQLIPSSLKMGSLFNVTVGLIVGGASMWLLNVVVPHFHHHNHESKLKKAAFFLFIGIFIHNFPEGLAIGAGGVESISFSLLVALAIAIHDIPETICVSAPLASTLNNRHKAFWLALLSSLPTIIGFLFSYYLLKELPSAYFSVIISATAGIMIYISVMEILWPIYQGQIKKNLVNASLASGAVFVLLLQLLIK